MFIERLFYSIIFKTELGKISVWITRRPFTSLAIFLISPFFLTGCFSGKGSEQSQPPVSLQVESAGFILADNAEPKDSTELGSSVLDRVRSIDLKVTNTGEFTIDPRKISSSVAANAGFSLKVESITTPTLAPRANLAVRIMATPARAGLQTGTLTLQLNDWKFRLKVSSNGVIVFAPEIIFQESLIQIGNSSLIDLATSPATALGPWPARASRAFIRQWQVRNPIGSTDTFTINKVEAKTATSSTIPGLTFKIINEQVAPGNSATIELSWIPDAGSTLEDLAIITITSTSITDPIISIPLKLLRADVVVAALIGPTGNMYAQRLNGTIPVGLFGGVATFQLAIANGSSSVLVIPSGQPSMNGNPVINLIPSGNDVSIAPTDVKVFPLTIDAEQANGYFSTPITFVDGLGQPILSAILAVSGQPCLLTQDGAPLSINWNSVLKKYQATVMVDRSATVYSQLVVTTVLNGKTELPGFSDSSWTPSVLGLFRLVGIPGVATEVTNIAPLRLTIITTALTGGPSRFFLRPVENSLPIEVLVTVKDAAAPLQVSVRSFGSADYILVKPSDPVVFGTIPRWPPVGQSPQKLEIKFSNPLSTPVVISSARIEPMGVFQADLTTLFARILTPGGNTTLSPLTATAPGPNVGDLVLRFTDGVEQRIGLRARLVDPLFIATYAGVRILDSGIISLGSTPVLLALNRPPANETDEDQVPLRLGDTMSGASPAVISNKRRWVTLQNSGTKIQVLLLAVDDGDGVLRASTTADTWTIGDRFISWTGPGAGLNWKVASIDTIGAVKSIFVDGPSMPSTTVTKTISAISTSAVTLSPIAVKGDVVVSGPGIWQALITGVDGSGNATFISNGGLLPAANTTLVVSQASVIAPVESGWSVALSQSELSVGGNGFLSLTPPLTGFPAGLQLILPIGSTQATALGVVPIIRWNLLGTGPG